MESTSSESGSSSGLSVTQAGVVGAMVSLAAVLLVLAGAYFSGWAIFGQSAKRAKKVQSERVMNDHMVSMISLRRGRCSAEV